jgi:hypothetical protein
MAKEFRRVGDHIRNGLRLRVYKRVESGTGERCTREASPTKLEFLFLHSPVFEDGPDTEIQPEGNKDCHGN